MSNIKKERQSFEIGALLLLASGLLVKVIGALFKIPLSNLLGDEGFGHFSAAYDLFNPFYALAMGGLPVAAARMIAADPEQSGRERQMHRVFAVCGWVCAGCFVLCIPIFRRIISTERETVYALLAIAPSVPLFFYMAAFRGSFEGRHNMKPTAVSDLIEALGKLVIGLGFVLLCRRWTDNDVLWAASALLGITLGVAAAMFYLWCKRPHLVKEGASDLSTGQLLGQIWRPALAALLISSAVGLVDALTVSPILRHGGVTASAAAYGLRSKAYTLYNLVPSVSAMLGIGAVPSLAKAVSSGDGEGLRQQTVKLLKMSAIVVFPAGLGMAVISRPIMALLYTGGESQTVGAQLLGIYAFAAVFAGLSVPMIHALQAIGRQRAAFRLLIGGMVVKVLLNFLLISRPAIGICGAAFATLGCYLVVFAVGLSVLCHAVGFKRIPSVFGRPLLAAVVCSFAAAVALIRPSKTLTVGAILLAAAVYVGMLLLLRPFSKQELTLFLHPENGCESGNKP